MIKRKKKEPAPAGDPDKGGATESPGGPQDPGSAEGVVTASEDVPPEPAAEEEAGGGEEAPEPGSLEGEALAALRAEAARAAEYLDQWQRAAAEVQNLQKRSLQQKQMAARLAVCDLLRALLPSIDNLERAIRSGEQDTGPGALLEGVRLVHGEILRVLTGQGVVELHPAGEPLDPNRHEAVSSREEPDVEENTVVEVIEKGYVLGDLVIRPARVVVARAPAPSAGEKDEAADDDTASKE